MMFLTLTAHLPVVVSASSHTLTPVCGGGSLVDMRTKFYLTKARKFAKKQNFVVARPLHLVTCI